MLLAGLGAGWSGQATPDLPSRDTIPPLQVLGGTLAFDARATAGRFTGTTSTIQGRVGGGALSGVRGWVEAPAASLVTGNDRRDRDMYKSLETDRFPSIRFDLDSTGVMDRNDDSVGVRLHGRLTVHGVVREVNLPAGLHRTGDTVALTTAFDLNVKDYQIGGLSKFLGLFRMEEVIGVRVKVLFGPVSPRHDADTTVAGHHHVPANQIPGELPRAVDHPHGESGGGEANDRGGGSKSHSREGGTRLGPDHHRSGAFQGDDLKLGGVDADLGGSLAGKRGGSCLAECECQGVAGRGHQCPVPEGSNARGDGQHEQPQDHEDHEHFDESDSTVRHGGRMPDRRVGARRLSTRAVA